MSGRPSSVPFTAVLLCLMVWAIPATAQQRLFARVGSTVAEIDTSIARFGTVLQTWTVQADSVGVLRTAPLVGGRYLAWTIERGEGEFALKALDTVSGSVLSVAIDQPASIIGVNAEGDELVGLERNSRIIVWNVRTQQTRAFSLPGPVYCIDDYALATEARLLMILHSGCGFVPSGPQFVDVVNLEEGSIRAFEVPFSSGQRIATDATGTRVWVGTTESGFEAPAGVGVYDAATGALLSLNTALVPVSGNSGPLPLIVDNRANVLMMVTENGLAALDGDTLQLLWSADAPAYRPTPILPGHEAFFDARVVAHPDADAIYAYEYSAQRDDPFGGQCHQSALIALDPATGQRLATRPAVSASGEFVCGVDDLVMTVAPARPANFRAEVSGRQVTLSWDRPAQTTHYELEAGSAPGLRDLLRVTPTSLPFVVENVPPGTYYVRVRALNYAGKGAYTEDLTVVVPYGGPSGRP